MATGISCNHRRQLILQPQRPSINYLLRAMQQHHRWKISRRVIHYMHKKELAEKALMDQKLLPLYYHDDPGVSLEILRALYEGGVRTVEYTNRGDSALENFYSLRKKADAEMPGLLLGIGTVKTRKSAKKYIEAGAEFIVAPSINEEVG